MKEDKIYKTSEGLLSMKALKYGMNSKRILNSSLINRSTKLDIINAFSKIHSKSYHTYNCFSSNINNINFTNLKSISSVSPNIRGFHTSRSSAPEFIINIIKKLFTCLINLLKGLFILSVMLLYSFGHNTEVADSIISTYTGYGEIIPKSIIIPYDCFVIDPGCFHSFEFIEFETFNLFEFETYNLFEFTQDEGYQFEFEEKPKFDI